MQRRAERVRGARPLQRGIEHRRHHHDAGRGQALLDLHRARHLGGAEAAIAFAKQVFRRCGAAVVGGIERDHLGDHLGVAAHVEIGVGGLRLDGAAPAGGERIDEDEIGEGEPGVRIVDELRRGAVVAVRAELDNARTGEAEMQIRGRGAGPAVEREGDRARRAVGALRDIGGVEHRADFLAGLVVERKRSGGRGVGERALVGQRDGFFGDRVRGQQAQHALRVGGLRGRGRGVESNREEERNNAKEEHGGPRKLGCSACCLLL